MKIKSVDLRSAFLGSIIGAGLLLGFQVSKANFVLDWDGSTWPGDETGVEPNPVNRTISNVDGSGIDFNFAWQSGVPFSAGGGSGPSTAPHDNATISNPSTWANILAPGFTPNDNYLAWRQLTPDPSPGDYALTVTLSAAVMNLRFLLFDLDNNGLNGNNDSVGWVDRVLISGVGSTANPTYTLYQDSGGLPVPAPDQTNNGDLTVNGGNRRIRANGTPGRGNLDPGDIRSTVLVTFAGPVLQFTIDYGSLAVVNPSSQFIGLSAITFDPIPEPSVPALALCGLLPALRRTRATRREKSR